MIKELHGDGLGAVTRSNVTHQGARQRDASKGKELSARCLLAPAQVLNQSNRTGTRVPPHHLPGLRPAAEHPQPGLPAGPWGGQELRSSSVGAFCAHGAAVLTPPGKIPAFVFAPAALLMPRYLPKHIVPLPGSRWLQ